VTQSPEKYHHEYALHHSAKPCAKRISRRPVCLLIRRSSGVYVKNAVYITLGAALGERVTRLFLKWAMVTWILWVMAACAYFSFRFNRGAFDPQGDGAKTFLMYLVPLFSLAATQTFAFKASYISAIAMALLSFLLWVTYTGTGDGPGYIFALLVLPSTWLASLVGVVHTATYCRKSIGHDQTTHS
jgi:hypothetical protein